MRVGLKMLFILALCAAPVVASHLAFYVFKPRGSAYGELILPTVDLPSTLPCVTWLAGASGPMPLRQQWLLVVVQGAECRPFASACSTCNANARDAGERDRLDKVWLIRPRPTPTRRWPFPRVAGGRLAARHRSQRAACAGGSPADLAAAGAWP